MRISWLLTRCWLRNATPVQMVRSVQTVTCPATRRLRRRDGRWSLEKSPRFASTSRGRVVCSAGTSPKRSAAPADARRTKAKTRQSVSSEGIRTTRAKAGGRVRSSNQTANRMAPREIAMPATAAGSASRMLSVRRWRTRTLALRRETRIPISRRRRECARHHHVPYVGDASASTNPSCREHWRKRRQHLRREFDWRRSQRSARSPPGVPEAARLYCLSPTTERRCARPPV